MSYGQKRQYDNSKPPPPFTSNTQMYITASTNTSGNNCGRYYYGYSGFLKWVPPEKLAGYLTSGMQSDGKKWFFPPGYIDPEVSDKLQLSPDQPMVPVGGIPQPQPTYQSYQPPPQPSPQQQYQPPPQQPFQPAPQQTWQPPQQPIVQTQPPQAPAAPKPTCPVSSYLTKEEIDKFLSSLSSVNEKLDVLCRNMANQVTETRVMNNLKRQKLNNGTKSTLMHALPGQFEEEKSGDSIPEEEGDSE